MTSEIKKRLADAIAVAAATKYENKDCEDIRYFFFHSAADLLSASVSGDSVLYGYINGKLWCPCDHEPQEKARQMAIAVAKGKTYEDAFNAVNGIDEMNIRITEIDAILENNLYEDEEDEGQLVQERETLQAIVDSYR